MSSIFVISLVFVIGLVGWEWWGPWLGPGFVACFWWWFMTDSLTSHWVNIVIAVTFVAIDIVMASTVD